MSNTNLIHNRFTRSNTLQSQTLLGLLETGHISWGQLHSPCITWGSLRLWQHNHPEGYLDKTSAQQNHLGSSDWLLGNSSQDNEKRNSDSQTALPLSLYRCYNCSIYWAAYRAQHQLPPLHGNTSVISSNLKWTLSDSFWCWNFKLAGPHNQVPMGHPPQKLITKAIITIGSQTSPQVV